MSKKFRLRKYFVIKHVKESHTLLLSARQRFYHIFWSLWRKLSWKMSLLVIFEILRLFVTHWLPMTSILFSIGSIYCNQIKCNYLRNKKNFLKLLLYFWNLQQILNILNQTMRLIADAFLKWKTAKYVFS